MIVWRTTLYCFTFFALMGATEGLRQGRGVSRRWTVPEGIKFGSLNRLKLQTNELQPLHNSKNADLVRVATKAIGLNFADIFTILGYYKAANQVRESNQDFKSFCPGLEFAGVVLEADGETTGFQAGDRVYGFTRFGAYADVVDVSCQVLQRLPDSWSYSQGASFLVNGLTAWHGLVTVAGMMEIQPNDPMSKPVVLVHSAAGGVGLWASEIAARRGAKVVGVVGMEEKKDTFLRRIQPLCQAAQCVVRCDNTKLFEKKLRDAVLKARSIDDVACFDCSDDLVQKGVGFDYVMESYGGKYFIPTMNLVNAGGSIATFGSTTYNGNGKGGSIPFLSIAYRYLNRPRIDPGELTSRNIRVGGFNLIFLTENVAALKDALDKCISCLTGGTKHLANATPPVVGSEFKFEDAIRALSALRSGKTVGKVVLTNDKNPALRLML